VEILNTCTLLGIKYGYETWKNVGELGSFWYPPEQKWGFMWKKAIIIKTGIVHFVNCGEVHVY
jgi:hypothetical protein